LRRLRALEHAEIMPKYRNLSIRDMITATIKKLPAAVDQAIEAENPKLFAAAYGQLTAACNTCTAVTIAR
jgi:hypothetical protein